MKRAALVVLLGCRPPANAPPPPTPLFVEHACDLAPSAGLGWLIEAKPRAIAEQPDLIPVISLVVSEARFSNFAKAHGGVDPRQTQDLCIAKYENASLTIAKTPFAFSQVDAAFGARMTKPLGRTVDVANPLVIRIWGDVAGAPETLLVLGSEALVHEQGKGGAARAAEAFALGKLKRAQPALRSPTLSHASELVGEAPLRVLSPGPFSGELAQGLGGLLRATTAIAVSVTPVRSKLVMRLVLTGAWGRDAPAAAERLAAAFHVLSESAIGHLLNLPHPVDEPVVRGSSDALTVDVSFDGQAIAHGLHDALDAEVEEIFQK